MRLTKPLCTAVVVAVAQVSFAAVLQPTSVRKLDTAVAAVAWLNDQTLLLADSRGISTFRPATGESTNVIPASPVPDGLPDPLSVSTDGVSVVANNGFARTAYACRVADKKRIFARSSPRFVVIDIAVWRDRLYVLGWPADMRGAVNPDGVAVWTGPVTGRFDQLLPLHRIQSGPESVSIFNDSIATYGGALTVERDGTVDVVTAAEPGVFQYSTSGRVLRTLGTGMSELVQHRMHDINFTYGSNALARYQRVINAHPTIDGLIATDDGPALVVRVPRGDTIGWELWYPDATRTRARVTLGVTRKGPFGHLSCDARGRELACVYQRATTEREGLQEDPGKLSTVLVRFTLPKLTSSSAIAAK
jgi:hypothetical protein